MTMTHREPADRTPGRSLLSDLRRLRTLVDPRKPLYRDAHYFAATIEVDPATMRRWLPPGIRLAAPARAELFTAYFPHCTYGSVYHEAGLFVHVKTLRGTGVHCPWMILDDDVALILGRELLGYPKKLGTIDWRLDGHGDGATLRAEATRHGHRLITMGGRLGEVITDPPPILGRPHRNVTGLQGLALPRVVAFTPVERPVEVRRVHDVDLSLGGSERDPLDQMGLGPVIEARLHRVDLAAALPPLPLRPLSPLYTVTRLRPRVL
ncbi:acetoacetate decarboxylase family protein [Streptomyces gamaensis]|uniref:Acetoacetate decarboxylase family protein n=1 Tax=Streptomyces gamaensis TaxID=1763542 RepID=A0ABW0YS72_9ACTN